MKASAKRHRTDAAPEAANGQTASAPTDITSRGKAAALEMLDFINYAWTPFHAVEEASKRLLAAGFQHISEREPWCVCPVGELIQRRCPSRPAVPA